MLVHEGLRHGRGQEHVDGHRQVHGAAGVGPLRPNEVELVMGVHHRLPVRWHAWVNMEKGSGSHSILCHKLTHWYVHNKLLHCHACNTLHTTFCLGFLSLNSQIF